jgi:hypothetical protein
MPTCALRASSAASAAITCSSTGSIVVPHKQPRSAAVCASGMRATRPARRARCLISLASNTATTPRAQMMVKKRAMCKLAAQRQVAARDRVVAQDKGDDAGASSASRRIMSGLSKCCFIFAPCTPCSAIAQISSLLLDGFTERHSPRADAALRRTLCCHIVHVHHSSGIRSCDVSCCWQVLSQPQAVTGGACRHGSMYWVQVGAEHPEVLHRH